MTGPDPGGTKTKDPNNPDPQHKALIGYLVPVSDQEIVSALTVYGSGSTALSLATYCQM
jgi:hypothetical protein